MITGASRGIGAAAAAAFAAAGARVIALSRSTGCDVADPARVEKAVSKLERIDVIVAAAGLLGPRRPLAQFPLDAWDRVMKVNVEGVLNVLRAAAPKLVKESVVLVLSSSAGLRPRAGGGAYAVSKAAVEALCRVAAAELPARVNAVNPGPTRTAMRAEYDPAEDPSTVKPPEVVAAALLKLAASGETGRPYTVEKDGSIT